MSNITIWLDLDPDKVDVSYLQNKFKEDGYNLIAEQIDFADEDKTIEMGMKADAVISSSEPWNERTLSAVKGQVKYIVRYGAGLDNIDLPFAASVGIPVGNVPGANAAAVAETALLHILNLGRRFTTCVDGVSNGVWPSTVTGNELDGKTVGLLGYGNIGRQLVRMMQGFDVNVLVYDPYLRDRSDANDRLHFVGSAEEVFRASDIISLHIPLTDETHGSINKEKFALMKPTAYLVNTCRGGVIDEADLIEAVTSGEIAGAGLDVLVHELPEKDDPLLHLPNVFVTSHMGAASMESEYRSQVIIAKCIEEYFAGKMPYNVKNM